MDKFNGSLASVAVCVWLAAGAYAASPEGMRLYVFSSGWLNLDKSGLQTGGTGKISVPVAFFLIKHPKGNVLFGRPRSALGGFDRPA